jgi:hypothetical protein
MADIIQLGISGDSSELVEACAQERAALKETESAFKQFGDVCVAAMTTAGNVSLAVLGEIGGALRTVTEGALTGFGMAMGEVAGKVAAVGAAVSATAAYFGSFWTTMKAGLMVAGWFNPWLKAVSIGLTVAAAATWAYRNADEYLNGELTKSIVHVEQTTVALGELSKAGDLVSNTLKNVSADLFGVGASMTQTIVDLTGISTVFRVVDSVASSVISKVASELTLWADGVRTITDVTLDWVDANGVTAASLREMAAASEALIAKQEGQRGLFGQLRAMQDAAAEAAQHASEMQRIASLQSVDAIDAEIRALQQKTSAAILAGEATEESQKKAAALFAALENQKNTVAGNDKAAALQAELAATEAINRAKEHQRDLENSAADQVARLTDQIDLLSGAATKADIAMREAMRAGLTAEQANEIARLTAELEKLQADKNKPEPPKAEIAKADRTTLKAAFSGSQEAASIFTRGIGGVDKDGNVIAKQQLTVQQQTLVAVKTIKMPQLQPISLGTA